MNKNEKFDLLRSTRHFGPFAFHLVWKDDFHSLLMELIKTKNIEEAGALIRLYQKLHPESKLHAEPVLDDVELIAAYASSDSSNKRAIMVALQRFQKLREEEEKMKLGIMKAHGLSDNTYEQT